MFHHTIYIKDVTYENSGNNSKNNSRNISSENGLSNSNIENNHNSNNDNDYLSINNLNVNNLSVNRSSIPFLAKTTAFFNIIMFIVSGQRWSVVNRYSTKVSKSANADNTVRQASSANDHISAYTHATERNRNSLSGSQTQ
ncbi:hypothetical protein PIROE2DRAFT_7688 [Piromyces sp. E2]|nr:hypothetical protein PIROE2DRAFT_7688 [Piromyces sp. E2]|eukprot:OUM65309.1 hypothetical protein PIROE2DRAFT_7688 [Piromyces sp. E2]